MVNAVGVDCHFSPNQGNRLNNSFISKEGARRRLYEALPGVI
jgi:hypothetical protein